MSSMAQLLLITVVCPISNFHVVALVEYMAQSTTGNAAEKMLACNTYTSEGNAMFV